MHKIDGKCKQYLKQACINEELVLFLNKNCSSKRFFNWIFVVMFYAALHYFYAFLVFKGLSIPHSHKSKNDFDLGALDLAKDKFYTNKNGVIDSAGVDYQQLFQWSWDVRYNPNKIRMPSKKEVKEARRMLERIQVVVFNEIGFKPVFNKNKEVVLKKVKNKFIKHMYNAGYK